MLLQQSSLEVVKAQLLVSAAKEVRFGWRRAMEDEERCFGGY